MRILPNVSFGLVLAALGLCGPATAADLCGALAMRDVAAMENASSVIPRGSYQEGITQYRVNNDTKTATFCSHGGYCYPVHVWVNGKKEEALRLVNCKIGEAASKYGNEVIYSVEVVRSLNSSALLRRDDLVNKLLGMGLCGACADNVAQWYTQRPDSPCAKLTLRTLEGDPAALSTLKSFPNFCTWNH
jgi:hypothetical protein